VSRPPSWISLIAATALIAGSVRAAGAQTYSVVLSIKDARPMAEAVLSLIRTYPVTITYEDPRYEYAGDLHDATRQVNKTRHPPLRSIAPQGGALQATYDVSQDTGAPVDMAGAIQNVIDANNLARFGGHFEVRQSGAAFHVVPTEVRDSKGRWIQRQSLLDTPITFSSGGEKDGFGLIEAILHEVTAASGEKIIAAGRPAIAIHCSSPGCIENERVVDATNEPARDVLLRLVSSLNPRYTWLLYYDSSERCYYFNLVLGVERGQPKIEEPRPKPPKPGDPTPGQRGPPANAA
jgi:hypothetical protein